jgi:hypothetical protein
MVMLKNPDLPATSKQLWLLHILTKSDTRELNITMAEASKRIEDIKSKSANNKSCSKIELVKSNKVMLGKIEVTNAYKEISKHTDSGFSVTARIYGIFPGGKNKYQLSWYKRENMAIIRPLFGHIRHDAEVEIVELNAFIKPLPIKFNDFKDSNYNVPDNARSIAISKAELLDDDMELYYLINSEYRTKSPDEIMESWEQK